jgi:hypothetical protein
MTSNEDGSSPVLNLVSRNVTSNASFSLLVELLALALLGAAVGAPLII